MRRSLTLSRASAGPARATTRAVAGRWLAVAVLAASISSAAPRDQRPPGMVLELEDGTLRADPAPEEIRAALLTLAAPDNRFAILSPAGSPLTYLQTHVDEPGLLLEYQIESTDRHFRAAAPVLSIEQVISVFQLYARDDPGWLECCSWERMPPEHFAPAR